MKAARFSRFGGPEVLEIAALPDPHPGPGQLRIAVRAAGVNASDWKKRQGLMDQELPQTLGYEAAGVVDELGEGTSDVATAASLPSVVETAARGLDQLGVAAGSTVLVNGASGSVGSAAVQLAVARGARVVGTAVPPPMISCPRSAPCLSPTATAWPTGFVRSLLAAST